MTDLDQLADAAVARPVAQPRPVTALRQRVRARRRLRRMAFAVPLVALLGVVSTVALLGSTDRTEVRTGEPATTILGVADTVATIPDAAGNDQEIPRGTPTRSYASVEDVPAVPTSNRTLLRVGDRVVVAEVREPGIYRWSSEPFDRSLSEPPKGMPINFVTVGGEVMIQATENFIRFESVGESEVIMTLEVEVTAILNGTPLLVLHSAEIQDPT